MPALPENIQRVGDFILQSMRNLESSGYEFTDEQMSVLLDPEQCNNKELFNLQNSGVAFFKIYNSEEEKPHLVSGRQRYYTPKNVKMNFGKYDLLLTKEWFDKYKHRELFTNWYNKL